MDYILVENGEIKGYPRALPQNWADVSNFYLLEEERLRQYGWYPVRFVSANVTQNEVITGQTFVIEENEVVQYEQKRTKTQQEIDEETNTLWENVREQRNMLLSETDWTQLSDVTPNLLNIDEWRTYRQELRDITNQLDPRSIDWPTKPV